ncbi:hypothetical protein ACLKMH_02950 [Psychromonas sp. KJ10-10]
MSQIQILVGSTLGGTEYVAEATQTLLEEAFLILIYILNQI